MPADALPAQSGAARQVVDDHRGAQPLGQSNRLQDAAHLVGRPAGDHWRERAMDGDHPLAVLIGKRAEHLRLSRLPALIDNDFDPIEAGARREGEATLDQGYFITWLPLVE